MLNLEKLVEEKDYPGLQFHAILHRTYGPDVQILTRRLVD